MADISQIPAIILCGGRGTRMEKETEFLPKPMLPVGNRPIVQHIMQGYAHFGVREFILCLGFKGNLIKDYFLNYRAHTSSLKLNMRSGSVTHLDQETEMPDWDVVLADTGEETLTGRRVEMALQHTDAPFLFVTYGDGVSNVDIPKLVASHEDSGGLATITAVRPSSRFGELNIEDGTVSVFSEKPQVASGWINGGFLVISREAFAHADWEASETLEIGLLGVLASLGRLNVYKHDGFWQCMDTVREHELLNNMYSAGDAPWQQYDGSDQS